MEDHRSPNEYILPLAGTRYVGAIMGQSTSGRLLVVSYTERAGVIR